MVSVETFAVPQSHQPTFAQQKAPQSRSVEILEPGPVVDRCNQMDVKTAKELLKDFRLFESFSIPRKRRMKRFSS
jgi:hypothetical protein